MAMEKPLSNDTYHNICNLVITDNGDQIFITRGIYHISSFGHWKAMLVKFTNAL